MTSLTLFSIRLNDVVESSKKSRNEVERIESNKTIIGALCSIACDNLPAASSELGINDQMKGVYRCLYRLSTLAFIVQKGDLDFFDIFINCVKKLSPFISQLPATVESSGKRLQSSVAGKSALCLTYLGYSAEVYANNAIGEIKENKCFSQKLWNENVNKSKDRLHQELLIAVNSLFDHSKLLNPYRDYCCDPSKVSIANEPDINVEQTVEDIEKIRSSLQSLLWNLTHEFSSPNRDNIILPTKVPNRISVEQLKQKIFVGRQGILDIFNQHASFTTGLLVCQILKEFIFIVGHDFMCREDLTLDRDLFQMFLSSNALSNEQRSCLIWFSSAISFNPYPLTVDSASSQNTLDFRSPTSVASFIESQQKDHQALDVILSVADASRNIFKTAFREHNRDAGVEHSIQLMSTTLSCCASLLKFQTNFLQICREFGAKNFRFPVLAVRLLESTIQTLSCVLGRICGKGNDAHIIPAAYLTCAVIEHMSNWLRFQIELTKEEKSNSLPNESAEIVIATRKANIEALLHFHQQISKDIMPNLQVIFSKSSLHNSDCVTDPNFSLYSGNLDSFGEENSNKYASIAEIISDRVTMKRLNSSDCCVAVVNAYSGFLRCQILLKELCESGGFNLNLSTKNQFETYFKVIHNLKSKIVQSSEMKLVISFSQCWYECLFLLPMMELLLIDCRIEVDSVIRRSPTFDSCVKTISENVFNPDILSMLKSSFIVEYYIVFIIIALLEPAKKSLCSQIRFSSYCRALFVFSCLLITTNGHDEMNTAVYLSKVFIRSFFLQKPLQSAPFSSEWISLGVQSFVEQCVESIEIKTPKSEQVSFIDIFLR